MEEEKKGNVEHKEKSLEKHKSPDVLFTVNTENVWKIASVVLGVLLLISIFTGGFGGKGSTSDSGNGEVAPSGNSGNSQPSLAVNAKDLEDDDAYLGKKDAPLTIVEFSDYQCPFCRSFWSQTLPQIKSEYIDTGKVKFVYRDFPLSFHPGSQPAAEATECAKEQGGNGMYFEFHDIIFSEQAKSGQGTVQFTLSDLKEWAKKVEGLKYESWEKCIDSGKYRNEVQKDMQAGTVAGVRGTPHFVVGSTPLSGAQPFSSFKAVIEAELAKK